DRQLDVVSLRDEQHRESAVHHRAVEIERISHRQHEADDLLADRKLFELLHGLGISCLAARGGEREQERLAHQIDEPEAMAAEDQESDGDQEAPQYGKPEVELEDELAVGDEDA